MLFGNCLTYDGDVFRYFLPAPVCFYLPFIGYTLDIFFHEVRTVHIRGEYRRVIAYRWTMGIMNICTSLPPGDMFFDIGASWKCIVLLYSDMSAVECLLSATRERSMYGEEEEDDINHWSIVLYVCNFLLIHMCALCIHCVCT